MSDNPPNYEPVSRLSLWLSEHEVVAMLLDLGKLPEIDKATILVAVNAVREMEQKPQACAARTGEQP